MTWRVTLLDGEFCIVTDDGRNEVHVGTTDQARQWAEWYVSKRNMPSDTTDWPLPGLQVFDVSGGDAALFVVGGEPVGTIGWNGVEWWWYGLSWELQNEGEPVYIDVDPSSARRSWTSAQASQARPRAACVTRVRPSWTRASAVTVTRPETLRTCAPSWRPERRHERESQ
jgi:hypothetical protein